MADRTQGERLVALETKAEGITKTVDSIDLKMSNIDTKLNVKFAMLEDNLEKKFGSLDGKYASKLTQTIVFGLCGAILMAVLGFIVLDPLSAKHQEQYVTITTTNPDGTKSTQVVPSGSAATTSTGTSTYTLAQPKQSENKSSSTPSSTTTQTPTPAQESSSESDGAVKKTLKSIPLFGMLIK